MFSELSRMTVPQIMSMGGSLVLVIATLAVALRYAFGGRQLRLRAGKAEASIGATSCDCSMRGIIMSTHRLTLAQTDALDVLLVAINEKVNGEVAAARTALQRAKTHHIEEMTEVAAAGGER